MLSEVLPMLVSVTVFAELVWPRTVEEKAKLDAESVTWVPVPLKPTVCGEPDALSVMATEPDRLPAADGLKITETVQLAPAATLTPQVLVWLKSAAFVPVIATLVMDSAALPEFETVMVWAALAVLTS